MKFQGARFEISIDGVPRSYRDRREIAVEAAGQLMAKYPHSAVVVKDLQSGKTVAADYKLDLGPALMPLTMRPKPSCVHRSLRAASTSHSTAARGPQAASTSI
jgi:hypothetical protein